MSIALSGSSCAVYINAVVSIKLVEYEILNVPSLVGKVEVIDLVYVVGTEECPYFILFGIYVSEVNVASSNGGSGITGSGEVNSYNIGPAVYSVTVVVAIIVTGAEAVDNDSGTVYIVGIILTFTDREINKLTHIGLVILAYTGGSAGGGIVIDILDGVAGSYNLNKDVDVVNIAVLLGTNKEYSTLGKTLEVAVNDLVYIILVVVIELEGAGAAILDTLEDNDVLIVVVDIGGDAGYYEYALSLINLGLGAENYSSHDKIILGEGINLVLGAVNKSAALYNADVVRIVVVRILGAVAYDEYISVVSDRIGRTYGAVLGIISLAAVLHGVESVNVSIVAGYNNLADLVVVNGVLNNVALIRVGIGKTAKDLVYVLVVKSLSLGLAGAVVNGYVLALDNVGIYAAGSAVKNLNLISCAGESGALVNAKYITPVAGSRGAAVYERDKAVSVQIEGTGGVAESAEVLFVEGRSGISLAGYGKSLSLGIVRGASALDLVGRYKVDDDSVAIRTDGGDGIARLSRWDRCSSHP